MKILFNIGHPAQVHLFKNLIWHLEKRGHQCKITTIDKEVSLYLLNSYGFDYEVVGTAKSSLFSKAIETIKIEHKLYKIAKVFNPDILVGGVGNIYVTHVGMLMRKPSIVFDDTEHAKIEHLLMDPFASVICTPSCYKKDLGKKQIRYNGYHELAYLHPNYFTPNPAVLDEIGLSKDDTFIVLRFVSWSASHDIISKGFTYKMKSKLANSLKKYGKIFITSESPLDKEFEAYRLSVTPEKLHSLLYYSSLCISEGSTTAVESALLGVPTVHFERIKSSHGGVDITHFLGYLNELANRYKIFYTFANEEQAFNKAIEFIQDNNAKEKMFKKRQRVLEDKIDVTQFMVEFIEDYPESFSKFKNQGEIT